MIAGQAEALARLEANLAAAKVALQVERWEDASLALLGCWLAVDELRRGMPRPDPANHVGLLLG